MAVESRFKLHRLSIPPDKQEYVSSLSIDSDKDYYYFEIASEEYFKALGVTGYVYPIPKKTNDVEAAAKPKRRCGSCRRSKPQSS